MMLISDQLRHTKSVILKTVKVVKVFNEKYPPLTLSFLHKFPNMAAVHASFGHVAHLRVLNLIGTHSPSSPHLQDGKTFFEAHIQLFATTF